SAAGCAGARIAQRESSRGVAGSCRVIRVQTTSRAGWCGIDAGNEGDIATITRESADGGRTGIDCPCPGNRDDVLRGNDGDIVACASCVDAASDEYVTCSVEPGRIACDVLIAENEVWRRCGEVLGSGSAINHTGNVAQVSFDVARAGGEIEP